MLLLLACPLPLQAADGLTFELLPGSVLRDDCLDCDRPPIVRSLGGTFLLTPAVDLGAYEVTDLALATPGGEYVVDGAGSYRQSFEGEPSQELDLRVEVNGIPGILLSSGPVPLEEEWPVLVLTVTETEPHDPFHVFSLDLVAAPRPARWVPYEVSRESIFIDECTICGRPTVPIPVTGAFLLGEVESGANPVVTYIVRDLDVRPVSGEFDYRVTGGGIYRQGGEVALTQELELLVRVNDTDGVRLGSGRVPVPVRFPAIDVQTEHENPLSPLNVYSLWIVAEPRAGEFLRGEVNADGAHDIADAVFTLSYLFAEGDAPTCLDAADANDDGAIDIADAVFLLGYLFGAGTPIPPPFPDCGLDETPDDLDCGGYSPCAR